MVTLLRWSLALFSLSALAGDGLDEDRRKLGDPDKRERMAAVARLAKRGEPEAWELVIGALADSAGEVADSAQWLLGGLADEEGLDALRGAAGLKSKDALVRERAAEVHGRLSAPVDADVFRRGLADREPRVRRALAAAVARRGPEGLVGDTEKLARALEDACDDRDPRAAGEALLALAAIDAPAAQAWWLRQKVPKLPLAVRCAAARGAAELGLRFAELTRLGEGAEPALRVELVEALSRLQSADGCRALVAMLTVEEEQRLARRINDRLRELSGLKHGRDFRPWRDWAAKLEPSWTPAPPAAEPAAPGDVHTATLVGLPILSERVAFLIDFSGSMWMEREGGKKRKDQVDVKMRECLEALPETTRFNVIPYTSEPVPWQPKLVQATKKNVAAALQWFESRTDTGSGNFWDAFLLALADPEVDTVVMLGDGAPSGGARYRVELLPDLLEQENLGRSVVVDSIVVDANSAKIWNAWAEIARRTGGRSLRVEL